MSQTWYAKHNGKTVGPITPSQLKQLVGSGKVKAATEVRLGEDGRWVSASKVKGLGFSLEEREARQLAETKALKHRPRPLMTPLALCLMIVFMVTVLVLMSMVQFQRIKRRANIRAKENEPVMQTTLKIEMIASHVVSYAKRNGGTPPLEFSDAFLDDTDGWSRSLRIESEGSPVSAYKIVSAGADGQFGTADDVAIRFNMNHEQIERINTYGTQEIEAELAQLQDSDSDEEQPGGRFTYSNGVVQILMARDAEHFQSKCKSERGLQRLADALGNHHDRLMDHVEQVDPRAKTPVPGGWFSDQQWAEVEEVAKGISLAEMKPIYDSILKEAGIDGP